MEPLLKKLSTGNQAEISVALKDFADEISSKFSFPELNEEFRPELWKALHDILKNEDHKQLHKLCLQVIRIISREKKDLNELVTKDYLHLLLCHAGLKEDKDLREQENHEIALEALMCICNITFNATIPREYCCSSGALEGILNRLHTRKDISSDIKHFDMKILFIVSALCPNMRSTLKDNLHGLRYLIDHLELVLKELRESNHNADVTGESNKLSVINTNLLIEILKTLFNLTLRPKSEKIMDEEEESHYLRLVDVLRDYLLIEIEPEEKKLDFDGHIIHLLLNMPDHCLKPLAKQIQASEDVPLHLRFQQYNMSAIHEMLRYLKSRFSPQLDVTNQNEILSPVLTWMTKLSKSDRIMRKYLRAQVLPPLTDIHTRPEQGNTIRNCLCRLLTSPITQVRDLAADFIFVLCKENVGRMIKYTGYGNAAGMFATRGLLNGENGNTQNYSSGGEDSETEEYNEFKHGINPVIGCYQEPKPSPTAHMTEEQKEYEAMKLVELMDNLTRGGVVRPCRIGADGKPEPIEHVLQLQEDLPRQQINLNEEDEDD